MGWPRGWCLEANFGSSRFLGNDKTGLSYTPIFFLEEIEQRIIGLDGPSKVVYLVRPPIQAGDHMPFPTNGCPSSS